MVIGIFGESCTGKSTLADKLKESIHAQVYTGRNYLFAWKKAKLPQSSLSRQSCLKPSTVRISSM